MQTQAFLLFACCDVILFCIAWIMLHPASATPRPVKLEVPAAQPKQRGDVIYIDASRPGCGIEIRKQRQAGYIPLTEKEGDYVVMVRLLNGRERAGAW